jgi:hypothetical protein
MEDNERGPTRNNPAPVRSTHDPSVVGSSPTLPTALNRCVSAGQRLADDADILGSRATS